MFPALQVKVSNPESSKFYERCSATFATAISSCKEPTDETVITEPYRLFDRSSLLFSLLSFKISMISVPALGLEPRNPKEEIYSLPQLPLCDTDIFYYLLRGGDRI